LSATPVSEKEKIENSIIIPGLLVAIMWAMQLLSYKLNADFGSLGIFPRTLSGLKGIVLAHFVHGGWEHIMSNTPAVLVLGSMMLYFYPSISKAAIVFIALLTGILVWIFARPSFHIGASGLVYGFAFFLFFSAIFRKDTRSLVISLFVILFYGGIVWGLLPHDPHISWEAHLAGALSGTLLAYTGRKADIQPSISIKDLPESEQIPSYKEFKKSDTNES